MAHTLVTVLAHPDDETFSSGGTIAKLVRQGVNVYSICATRGEAGMRTGLEDDPRSTGEIREAELRRAADILGIREIRFLDFMDGTLHEVDQEDLKKKIERELDDLRPDVVLTFEPNGVSGHSDHKTMSRLATEIVKESAEGRGYPKRLFYFVLPASAARSFTRIGMDGKPILGVPDETIHIWSNIEDVFDIKARAMKEHQSQIKDVTRHLSRESEALFRECFIQAWPETPTAKETFFDEL